MENKFKNFIFLEFIIIRLYIFDLLLPEIPNIIQIFSSVTILGFLLNRDSYRLTIIIFFVLFILYFAGRFRIFVKKEIHDPDSLIVRYQLYDHPILFGTSITVLHLLLIFGLGLVLAQVLIFVIVGDAVNHRIFNILLNK